MPPLFRKAPRPEQSDGVDARNQRLEDHDSGLALARVPHICRCVPASAIINHANANRLANGVLPHTRETRDTLPLVLIAPLFLGTCKFDKDLRFDKFSSGFRVQGFHTMIGSIMGLWSRVSHDYGFRIWEVHIDGTDGERSVGKFEDDARVDKISAGFMVHGFYINYVPVRHDEGLRKLHDYGLRICQVLGSTY